LALQYHVLSYEKFCFHLVKQQKRYLMELQIALTYLIRRIYASNSYICLGKIG
jgi:hypothetical protein